MKKILLLAGLVFAFSACATDRDYHDHDHHHGHDGHGHDHHGHDHHDHHHDHQHGMADGRLLVATADGTLWLFDAHDGDEIAHFDNVLSEGSIAVYGNFTGELGYAINRNTHQVAIIHSGQKLEEHDGHEDLVFIDPSVLGIFTEGLRPTHFNTTLGRSAIYNDQSGNLTIFDETTLMSQGIAASASFAGAEVDHGAMVLLHDRMLVGYLNQARVDVMDYEGNVSQVIENAPRLHGQARIGRHSIFGLSTGVMVIEQRGSNFEATTIPNPAGSPENARVGTVYGHPVRDFFVGNFGQGLALIDPVAKTFTPFDLPTMPWRFGFDRSGEYIVVLGRDGILYALEIEDDGDLHIHSQVQVVEPHNPDAPAGSAIPVLVLGSKIAYVSNPAARTILEVHLHDGDIEAEFVVPAAASITGMVLLVTDGIVH